MGANNSICSFNKKQEDFWLHQLTISDNFLWRLPLSPIRCKVGGLFAKQRASGPGAKSPHQEEDSSADHVQVPEALKKDIPQPWQPDQRKPDLRFSFFTEKIETGPTTECGQHGY